MGGRSSLLGHRSFPLNSDDYITCNGSAVVGHRGDAVSPKRRSPSPSLHPALLTTIHPLSRTITSSKTSKHYLSQTSPTRGKIIPPSSTSTQHYFSTQQNKVSHRVAHSTPPTKAAKMCRGHLTYNQCYFCKCTNYKDEVVEELCYARCRILTAIQYHQTYSECLKCEELRERTERGEDLLAGKYVPENVKFW